MKTYVYHQDPGHGWVAVKRKELIELGVADMISTYSYERGGTVYVEEDGDCSKWLEAYRAKHGESPKFDHRHTDKRSPIRSYASYKRPSAVFAAERAAAFEAFKAEFGELGQLKAV